MAAAKKTAPRSPRSSSAAAQAPAASKNCSEAESLAETKLRNLEEVFSALAHEQRRHILLTLQFRGGTLSAGDIAARFQCSWPTTSRHLRVLEDAGLIVAERRGRERHYRLDRERLLAVTGDWLRWFDEKKS